MEVDVDRMISRADAIERCLLQRLTDHPVLRRVASLTRTELVALLLQRRFISMIFTPVYDMGIDALSDLTPTRWAWRVRSCVRSIRRAGHRIARISSTIS